MPDRKDLEAMKKSELLLLAKRLGMKGFSRLRKKELIDSIVAFAKEKGEELQEKVKEIVDQASLKSTIKRHKDKLLKALGLGGEEDTKGTEEAKEARPQKEPDERPVAGAEKEAQVVPPEGKEGHAPPPAGKAPASPEDPEALARERMSSMRYEELPIMFRAQVLRPEDLREVDRDLPPLPDTYGEPRVFLMARDPRWLLAYWDIPQEVRDRAGRSEGGKLTLRLHDVTGISFDGTNSWAVYVYELNEIAGWWYIPVPGEGRTYLCEIGYTMPDGSWRFVARSWEVTPPPGGPSPWVHDVFITLPFDEPLPYEMGKRIRWLGEKVPARHLAPEERLEGTPHEPAAYAPRLGAVIAGVSSPGVASYILFGEEGKEERWDVLLDTTVRILGLTEEGVRIMVDGREVEVSEDGTFSVELQLKEGSSTHVVTAVGPDGRTRRYTLSLYRNTAIEEE